MDSGVYLRDGLERSSKHLLEHVGLGPGNEIVMRNECRLPSQLWSVLTSCCQSTSVPASSSTAPSAAWAA